MKSYRDEIESSGQKANPTASTTLLLSAIVVLLTFIACGVGYLILKERTKNTSQQAVIVRSPEPIPLKAEPAPPTIPSVTPSQVSPPSSSPPVSQKKTEPTAISALSAAASAVAKDSDDLAMIELAALLRQDLENNIERAMRDSRVVNGMTRYQVQQVWGRPTFVDSGSKLDDFMRKAGIFEYWYYDERKMGISFDRNGTVIGKKD